MTTKRETAAQKGRRKMVPLAEGAAYLGKSKRWLRERITEGTIHGYQLGGGRLIFVDPDEIADMLRPIPTVGSDAA